MLLHDLYQAVEKAIHDMGIHPEETRGEEAGQWTLLREEMHVYLDAWENSESNPWNYFVFEKDKTVFQISVPFCYAPTLKRDEFLQEMLVVNLNLMYGKFTFNEKDNVTALVYRVPGISFQTSDLKTVVDSLCYYAEMAYHVLKDEFNLKRVLAES
ncbi:MAG: YbjN domain-containing protein [Bacteroidetes bacterium]|nr:YbjN domain-containing protein [Bacteroidota bacterium]